MRKQKVYCTNCKKSGPLNISTGYSQFCSVECMNDFDFRMMAWDKDKVLLKPLSTKINATK